MHECKRDGECECVDLLVFYITLLHLTGDTSDIKTKLEAVQIQEPQHRLPFKAFLAWVQLEMHLGRLAEAQNLINGYINLQAISTRLINGSLNLLAAKESFIN